MEFEISVDIAAPPEVVWAVMADAERWHEWTPSVTSIKVLGAGPLGIGSRAWVRQPKFPPAMWKVTALQPGRSFTWRSGFPGMWVDAHHSVEPIATGTRATLRLYFFGVLGRWVGHVTRHINERYLALEAAGLKKRSEERRSA